MRLYPCLRAIREHGAGSPEARKNGGGLRAAAVSYAFRNAAGICRRALSA